MLPGWGNVTCENFDQIFQVGDTLIIELSGADPNGLSSEFKVSTPGQALSDWKPETTLDTYTIEEKDRGNIIGIGLIVGGSLLINSS